MYEINVNKFIGKIAEKGYTKKSFAKAMGISEPTFFRYINNPKIIPYWFIVKSVELLCETFEEARIIFFTPKLTPHER